MGVWSGRLTMGNSVFCAMATIRAASARLGAVFCGAGHFGMQLSRYVLRVTVEPDA